jgi:MFS family permease
MAVRIRGARRTVLSFAFSLAVITYLDRVCISAAAPFMMRELGLSLFQMSLVFGAFTLAYSIFEVPTGWMGDVFGARKVLTRIVLWWSAFTMLTATASSYLSLVVIRFLFGAGEAGAFPNMSRAFSQWFPPVERGKANGILFLGSRLGGALAPALALLIIRHWGWRVSFCVFGATGIFWALAWYLWYRDDPSQHPQVRGEELSWIRQGEFPRPESSFGQTAVPWRKLLTSRNLHAICLMYFAFGYGLYFGFTWLPTYLIRVLDFTVLQGGFLAGLPFLLAGGADVLGGWLTDRLAGSHGLKVARCGLGSLSFTASALLLFLSTQAQSRVGKALLIAFALASADLALSACWSVCLDVGKSYAGIITGFMNTFANLGGFLGPIVVGLAVERYHSWTIPFHIAAVIYAIGALAWLAVDPNQRLDQ